MPATKREDYLLSFRKLRQVSRKVLNFRLINRYIFEAATEWWTPSMGPFNEYLEYVYWKKIFSKVDKAETLTPRGRSRSRSYTKGFGGSSQHGLAGRRRKARRTEVSYTRDRVLKAGEFKRALVLSFPFLPRHVLPEARNPTPSTRKT